MEGLKEFTERVLYYLPGAIRTELELLADAYTPLAMERNKAKFDERMEGMKEFITYVATEAVKEAVKQASPQSSAASSRQTSAASTASSRQTSAASTASSRQASAASTAEPAAPAEPAEPAEPEASHSTFMWVGGSKNLKKKTRKRILKRVKYLKVDTQPS